MMTYVKFTILVHTSLVIITLYRVLSLSDQSLGEERKRFLFLKIMHFHYMTYGHALAQEPLYQGS